jgi:hypothetical protein
MCQLKTRADIGEDMTTIYLTDHGTDPKIHLLNA